MRILEIMHADHYCIGFAVSTRGKRYRFIYWHDRNELDAAREIKMSPDPEGRTAWWMVKPPAALCKEVANRIVN